MLFNGQLAGDIGPSVIPCAGSLSVVIKAKVREKSPESFKDHIALIEKLQAKAKNSLWFRGCGKRTYGLTPSLYRHRTSRTKDSLQLLERQMMMRFRQRSIPLHNRPLTDP